LYYSSTGAKSQVEKGDCTEEEPQWDEKGAIDYAGKLVWGGYKQHQGKTTAEAKAIFVKLLRDAQADKKNNFF
jgi:AP-3 complex subunit delta-1|tara:strand:- start:1300 stop:1518 length:219 start_codon:yes stop_codon:yes gene_type:complete